jgi:hypothetical protein
VTYGASEAAAVPLETSFVTPPVRTYRSSIVPLTSPGASAEVDLKNGTARSSDARAYAACAAAGLARAVVAARTAMSEARVDNVAPGSLGWDEVRLVGPRVAQGGPPSQPQGFVAAEEPWERIRYPSR